MSLGQAAQRRSFGILWEDSDLPEQRRAPSQLVGGCRQGEEAGGPAPALSINSSSLWAPNTNVKHPLVARWHSAALYHAHPFLFLSAPCFSLPRLADGEGMDPDPTRPTATCSHRSCLPAVPVSPAAGREGVFLQSGANK